VEVSISPVTEELPEGEVTKEAEVLVGSAAVSDNLTDVASVVRADSAGPCEVMATLEDAWLSEVTEVVTGPNEASDVATGRVPLLTLSCIDVVMTGPNELDSTVEVAWTSVGTAELPFVEGFADEAGATPNVGSAAVDVSTRVVCSNNCDVWDEPTSDGTGPLAVP
jgi:hypothetical protein